ncbi:cupin domain-containing protein [Streptomyces sp. NPDC056194]|uniref:cupin domain-containing protein n=1 Tax=unclassified Streptomyces TaxID=2593676 RepID=UPI0035DBA463
MPHQDMGVQEVFQERLGLVEREVGQRGGRLGADVTARLESHEPEHALLVPSRGSTELGTWTVTMNAGATGPEHSISREQVWTVTKGALEVTCRDRTEKVTAGRTLVLPPGLLRRIHAPEQTEAHVSMPSDGVASVPGTEGTRELPWAR